MASYSKEIAKKVACGERLSREDGLFLLEDCDILSLGEMASQVKEELHGQRVYFITNRHINPSNICVTRCPLCAFGREATAPGAYTLTLDQIKEKVLSTPEGVTEFHIVGGNNPDLDLEYYQEAFSLIQSLRPGVHLQALTAVEIDFLATQASLSVEEVLIRLKKVGLGSLPGGGAEIFSPRVREKIAPGKISGDGWLQIMETAHRLGLKTNATMLYGHLETNEERIHHLLQLRDLQDRTGGFQAFIPLAFHPENTSFSHLSPTTGVDDLRVLSVSRLLLDNFPHIKAFWIMIGLKLAQISLHFGVSDMDGTVVEEKITHAAGAQTKEAISQEEIVHLIQEAGFQPVERDTLYRVVRQYEKAEDGE